jgi:hypothetical protein
MKIKYCNKEMLDKINKRAIVKNYNRAVRQDFIDALPDDVNFPITLCLPHEHAAGQLVEPHMRCRIMTGQSLFGPCNDVFVDVEMGMFELLPEAEVSAKAERSKSPVDFSSN